MFSSRREYLIVTKIKEIRWGFQKRMEAQVAKVVMHRKSWDERLPEKLGDAVKRRNHSEFEEHTLLLHPCACRLLVKDSRLDFATVRVHVVLIRGSFLVSFWLAGASSMSVSSVSICSRILMAPLSSFCNLHIFWCSREIFFTSSLFSAMCLLQVSSRFSTLLSYWRFASQWACRVSMKSRIESLALAARKSEVGV